MAAVLPITAQSRVLMSGNKAVARAAWEAGAQVAGSGREMSSTGRLAEMSRYSELDAECSSNEKLALETAIAAAGVGSRVFCAMESVGVNAASDALMAMARTGVLGGLVIAIIDDIGPPSSPNEQDSRRWGRFGQLPILEPADVQEAYEMTRAGFDLSEEFATAVIVRLSVRICHREALVSVGERVAYEAKTIGKNLARPVMAPSGACLRVPLMDARERELSNYSDLTALNILLRGKGDKASRRVGFITAGPAYVHVRESFPDAPVLKMGLSYPLPMKKIRGLIEMCKDVVVVEQVEPLVENEIKAEGFKVHGKDILPRFGELSSSVLELAITRLLDESAPE